MKTQEEMTLPKPLAENLLEDEMICRLEEYFESHNLTEGDIHILDLENISSGWESDLYAFRFQTANLAGELVLRLYNGEGAEEKAENEYRNLLNLLQFNYPVPWVYVYDSNSDWFGKPFIIMQRVPGEQMWAVFDRASRERRIELSEKFSQVFLQLHHLDWRMFIEPGQEAEFLDPYQSIDAWLDIAYEALEAYPEWGFSAAVEWFEARRADMACRRPAVTHNDFHPGNMLLLQNDELVVIDWTGFNISDPRFDLAWTLMLINAYSGPEWYQQFLKAYQQAAGGPIENLAYFEAFACIRRMFDIMVALHYGAESHGLRAEAVEQIRTTKTAHQRVYQMLQDRMGIPFPDVEALLASL